MTDKSAVPSSGKNTFFSKVPPDRQQHPPSPSIWKAPWTKQPYKKLTTHFHPVGGYSSSAHDGS